MRVLDAPVRDIIRFSRIRVLRGECLLNNHLLLSFNLCLKPRLVIEVLVALDGTYARLL